tara:strand:+ start:120 stop:833 length:714 start_codon:yes stop_codon:yes gene_type:complete
MSKINEAIFPIVTFDPDNNTWNCLGTGYFINPVGAFATARHLFMTDGKQTEKTLYGVQNINNEEYHLRPATKLISHNEADVMIGTLGKRRIEQKDYPASISKYFALDFDSLSKDDEISTFAYPNTIKEILQTGETEFSFKGKSSNGRIVDLHEKGTSKVKNRCYQTTMRIDSGASGGPVIKNGYIVGVNSSSFDLFGDEEPISFITPIDYILDLYVKEKERLISVKELIESGYIKTK